jgi:hypothetical protein
VYAYLHPPPQAHTAHNTTRNTTTTAHSTHSTHSTPIYLVDDLLEVHRHARLLQVAVVRAVVDELGDLVEAQLLVVSGCLVVV